jgi:hypothetical protein
MASRSVQDHYSDKSEQSQHDGDVADVPLADAIAADPTNDDLLSDFDLTPNAEAESDEEIMKALNAYDAPDDDTPDESTPVTPIADWLTDAQELARKHRPFAPWQIVQIICALNAVDDPAADAGTNR